MRDSVSKGRHSTGHLLGQTNAACKLTERQVREILLSEGTNKAVGKRFGVAETTISMIRRRVIWKHIVTETDDLGATRDHIEKMIAYSRAKDYYPTESELREAWINDADAGSMEDL